MRVYVSLTSIYDNLDRLKDCLRSLLKQTYTVNNIFLFLSEEPYLKDKGFPDHKIPEWLREMPITVKWTFNDGSYRKLLPLLSKVGECLIITCDDDTYYSPTLIEELMKAYDNEGCVVAYRCKLWEKDVPYAKFREPLVQKDIHNFHTGKGGVLYPSWIFKDCDMFNMAYLDLCPTNDDIWFNFWRMKAKVPCYCIGKEDYIDMINPDCALWNNFNEKNNDAMLEKTYKFIFPV